jgi:hypothetical protein
VETAEDLNRRKVTRQIPDSPTRTTPMAAKHRKQAPARPSARPVSRKYQGPHVAAVYAAYFAAASTMERSTVEDSRLVFRRPPSPILPGQPAQIRRANLEPASAAIPIVQGIPSSASLACEVFLTGMIALFLCPSPLEDLVSRKKLCKPGVSSLRFGKSVRGRHKTGRQPMVPT